MRIIEIDSTTKKVVSVKIVMNDYILQDDEFESEDGQLGQIQQTDGSFIDSDPIIANPIETLDDKIARLERQVQEDNLIQFDVLATIYEELLSQKGSV